MIHMVAGTLNAGFSYDPKSIRMSMEEHKKAAGPFNVRSKVWIENDAGEVVLGPGRYRILEAVQRLGSLQAAARPRSAAWGMPCSSRVAPVQG